MKTNDEIFSEAKQYLKTNKHDFIKEHTKGLSSAEDKVVYFTAGMSG